MGGQGVAGGLVPVGIAGDVPVAKYHILMASIWLAGGFELPTLLYTPTRRPRMPKLCIPMNLASAEHRRLLLLPNLASALPEAQELDPG